MTFTTEATTTIEFRQQTGLTRVQMSELLPVPYRTIEDWAAGKSAPPAFLWRALRDLELDLVAKVDGDGNIIGYFNPRDCKRVREIAILDDGTVVDANKVTNWDADGNEYVWVAKDVVEKRDPITGDVLGSTTIR